MLVQHPNPKKVHRVSSQENKCIQLVDAGVAISAVSVAMDRLSTRTTEQHCAREARGRRQRVARTFENLDEVQEEYGDSQMPKGFENRRTASQEDR